jgi:hypothetical protein
MSHRFYESTPGATGGCMIGQNQYNYHEFIDIDNNQQYAVYHGHRLPLTFIESEIKEFMSSVGIAPHREIKKIEHWRINNSPLMFIYIHVFSSQRYELAYVKFNGKEYRLKNQSPMIGDR